jgi:serine/threonine-protein kinase
MADVGVSEGTVIDGKYRLERLLGRGGMGAVYAARHLTLGELYAIKFVAPGPGDRDEAHARFRREAKSAALLTSDHVAKVMDVGVHGDDELYIVMEHLDGMDLDVLARQRGRLPVAEASELVIQACRALEEAHDKGIIHRDIKLANLFLTTSHGEPLLKVLDFGVSKTVGADMTHTAAVLGSPKYMSPEQMDDPRAVDARTDVWSLGVVLYRLVSGRLPFDGETLGRICMAVMREPPPPLLEVQPSVPPGFAAIVDRCLAKDRAQRFASVRELSAALAPFAAMGAVAPAASLLEPPDAATLVDPTVLATSNRVDTTQNRTWSKTGVGELSSPTTAAPVWRSTAALVVGLGAIFAVLLAVSAAAVFRARGRAADADLATASGPVPPAPVTALAAPTEAATRTA